MAKSEKLRPIEVELRKLESVADSIVQEMEYMKQREAQMRDTNGWTRGGKTKQVHVLTSSLHSPKRIYQRACTKLLAPLHSRINRPGYLANPVLEAVLPDQEARELSTC